MRFGFSEEAAVPPDDASAEAPFAPGVAMLHQVAEQLLTRFSEGQYLDQVAQAKEVYFEQSGKVFDDDGDIFETRLAAFLEWYTLERPLEGHGEPPSVVWLRTLDPTSVQARALAAWSSSHRSLFDVAEVSDHAVGLEDLLGGARFTVKERRSTIGFEVGQVVEARLVWDGAAVVFGKTFLFHPREARQEVLELVDDGLATGLAPQEILGQLARLHLRWCRSRQISAIRIYGESRVGSPDTAA